MAVSLPEVRSLPLTVTTVGLLLVAESPVSVIVLVFGTVVEFKAISAGLKVHEPDVQERAMVSVKLATNAAMDTVKVVVVVPMGRDWVVVGELSWKVGFPVPVKLRLEEPLWVLSVTVIPPLIMPVLEGVKVIEKAQDPPTNTVNGEAPQVVVSAKSVEVEAMLVTVTGTCPLLVIITVCEALVVFKVVAGNTRLVGENSTCARPVTPVPVSETRCGLPAALSVMASNWVSFDSTVGVKVTLMVQVPPPPGTVDPQLLVSAKSPAVAILVIWSGSVPAFTRVTTEETPSEVTSAVVFSVTLPKFIFCGVKATPGRLL